MHLLVALVVSLAMLEAGLADNRPGPCPGIPLDSCECFQHLYDIYVEVTNMTDIVARNWEITLWYQDIGHSFQKLLHTTPDSTLGLAGVGV